jgi:hypothetical protein
MQRLLIETVKRIDLKSRRWASPGELYSPGEKEGIGSPAVNKKAL